MRFVHEIITAIRREAKNEKPGTGTPSIGDLEILQYLNDAQDRMQNLISGEYPMVFATEEIITPVVDQEAYTLTGRVFLDNRLISVEFSPTGELQDYYELEQRTMKDRNTDSQEDAAFYIRRGSQILINPIPNSTTPRYRVTYEQELDDLALRLGDVKTTKTGATTAIPINTEYEQTELEGLGDGDLISIFDPDGTLTYEGAYVASTGYDAVNNEIDIDSVTFVAGECTAGFYVVKHRDVVLKSQLPDTCERYLIAYGVLRLLEKDRSDRVPEQIDLLAAMESEIVGGFADMSHDVDYIPILDSEIM